MRRLIVLLACTAPVLAAPQDLRPRYGDGFAGFKVGSSVRMKLTRVVPNRTPIVTITTSTLKKVAKNALTIERVSQNPLTDPTKSSSTVPPAGNAAANEKEVVKKLSDETIEAAGKKWACTRTEHTVTGPAGKRVITEWIAKAPLMRIKRITKSYDMTGKAAGTASTLLSKAPAAREVGGKTVVCIGYRTIQKSGSLEQRMETWSSRQVPGDFAGGEVKFFLKGKLSQTLHLKVIRFEAK
ncbi:MAG: hypothetical protein ACYS0E_08365 [Planctomycetota bacterium]